MQALENDIENMKSTAESVTLQIKEAVVKHDVMIAKQQEIEKDADLRHHKLTSELAERTAEVMSKHKRDLELVHEQSAKQHAECAQAVERMQNNLAIFQLETNRTLESMQTVIGQVADYIQTGQQGQQQQQQQASANSMASTTPWWSQGQTQTTTTVPQPTVIQ